MMFMNYSITISYNNDSEKVKFAVLPGKISFSIGSKNKTVEILNLGEITKIKSRPQMQIKWSGFFPANGFQGIKVKEKPKKICQKIKKFKSGKKPCHLVVTGNGVSVNIYCTIENFDYDEEGGAVGDVNYNITLKEYRHIAVRKAVKGRKGKYILKKVGARINNTDVTTYTIKKGDTLYRIAKKFLGSGSKKSIIYNLNKQTLDKAAKKRGYKSSKKGTRLFKGTKIKIPEKYML